jgi:hypothetical protein
MKFLTVKTYKAKVVVDGGEWSAFCPSQLNPEKRAPVLIG